MKAQVGIVNLADIYCGGDSIQEYAKKNAPGCFDYMKLNIIKFANLIVLLKKIPMRNFLMMEVKVKETVFEHEAESFVGDSWARNVST